MDAYGRRESMLSEKSINGIGDGKKGNFRSPVEILSQEVIQCSMSGGLIQNSK